MTDHTTICACGCNQIVPKAKHARHQNKHIKGHAPTARRPLAERFEKYVDRRSPNECWLWVGDTDSKGYGRIGKYRNGVERAHRVSWELANGPIPDSLHVMHKCDNPACVNPAHLMLGTHLDNMADMRQKGRQSQKPGEANGRAKLTAEQVAEIRARYAQGETNQAALAREYGVLTANIWRIVNYRLWKHI